MNQEKIFTMVVIGLVMGVTAIAIFVVPDFITVSENVNAIRNLENLPDIAIFGSSRVMHIHNSSFPNMTCINHGVAGANIEDIIVLTQAYDKRKRSPNFPDIVLIGVDKWTFDNYRHSDEMSENKHVAILGEYAEYFNKKYSNIRMRLTLQNFEALLERVKMGISENTTTPYATDIEENNQNDKAIEEIIEEIDQRAEDMSSDRIRIVDYDDRITHANFREFERFQMFENYVQTLIEKNITVIFYCDPYHPIAYSKAQDEKEKEPTMLSLMDIEVYFKNFAQANGILIIGSYNPHVYNLTSIDFFNGDHTVSQTFAKIISAHSHELYDLLYTDIYSTYEEYASALAESQAELLG